MRLPLRRSRRQTSSPSTPGISTSRMTASGVGTAERVERLLAVGRQVDVVALERERAPQRLANRPLVIDHQDLHRRNCAR